MAKFIHHKCVNTVTLISIVLGNTRGVEVGELKKKDKVLPGPVCFKVKFSSSNFDPYIDFPPVPLWLVKSPP